MIILSEGFFNLFVNVINDRGDRQSEGGDD